MSHAGVIFKPAFSDAPLCDVLITKDRDSHGHAGPGAKRAEDEPEV